MKFAFHMRQPFEKTLRVAAAVKAGALRYNDHVEIIEGFNGVEDVDGLILFGIGGESAIYWDAYRRAGKSVVFIDKGYSRMPYFRVAVNGFQPYSFVARKTCAHGRLKELGLNFPDLEPRGEHILFDGASNKYCLWHRLGHWVDWGQHIVNLIRQVTDAPIIYRPRPSHNEPVAVDGAELSTRPLSEDLARARVVVTHGGNIAWDAAQVGVPIFTLDKESFASPIACTDFNDLWQPRCARSKVVTQWAANVAHCQYTLSEFASGLAWAYVKSEIKDNFDED